MKVPRPYPMPYFVEGVTYYGNTGNKPYEIDPEEIALYVHCRSGVTHEEFLIWLQGELDTLQAIDPMCDK